MARYLREGTFRTPGDWRPWCDWYYLNHLRIQKGYHVFFKIIQVTSDRDHVLKPAVS